MHCRAFAMTNKDCDTVSKPGNDGCVIEKYLQSKVGLSVVLKGLTDIINNNYLKINEK